MNFSDIEGKAAQLLSDYGKDEATAHLAEIALLIAHLAAKARIQDRTIEVLRREIALLGGNPEIDQGITAG